MNTRQTTILVIGLVLLINGLSFLGLNYYVNNIMLVGNGEGVEELVSKKVIEKKITETNDITDMESTITKTIDEVLPSVVSIVISQDIQYYYPDPFGNSSYIEKREEKVGGGTGIIVSDSGYILTNKHVVSNASSNYSVLLKNGDVLKVDKIWKDPVLDLAVVHVVDENGKSNYNLEPAKIIDFKSNVKIGQFVLAIGNALAEYDNSVTLGILSAKGRELDSGQGSVYMGLYQTDAAINPGNSGGPLMDINGQVIGVNTAITAQGQGVGFVIPISKQLVEATLKSIKEESKIVRPYIGVQFAMLDKTMAYQNKLDKYEGALITNVLANTPASKAGLKTQDIVLKVSGVDIDSNNTLIQNLYTHNPGDTVTFLVWRDGQNKELKVELGEQ